LKQYPSYLRHFRRSLENCGRSEWYLGLSATKSPNVMAVNNGSQKAQT
jgi:hypothetical protein